jgi:hypothetical protein
MIGFILRILVTFVLLTGTVSLFATGYWGWGLSALLPLAVVIFSFFRNENVILALNQMRIGNQDKAKRYIIKLWS